MVTHVRRKRDDGIPKVPLQRFDQVVRRVFRHELRGVSARLHQLGSRNLRPSFRPVEQFLEFERFAIDRETEPNGLVLLRVDVPDRRRRERVPGAGNDLLRLPQLVLDIGQRLGQQLDPVRPRVLRRAGQLPLVDIELERHSTALVGIALFLDAGIRAQPRGASLVDDALHVRREFSCCRLIPGIGIGGLLWGGGVLLTLFT